MLTACATLYAQSNAESILTIQNLIDDDLFSNENIIAEEALQLSMPERVMLYDKYEKGVAGPFLLNLMLGYGIGSYRQGDTTFAVMSTLTDLTCNFMILSALIQSIGTVPFIDDDIDPYSGRTKSYEKALSKITLFSSIKAGWDLIEIIRPFFFKYAYNTTLENVLGLNEKGPEISLKPVIDTKGNAGISIGFSF